MVMPAVNKPLDYMARYYSNTNVFDIENPNARHPGIELFMNV